MAARRSSRKSGPATQPESRHKSFADKGLHRPSRQAKLLPIFLLTAGLPRRIRIVTHLPRLSPARVTRIKGRFFYCAKSGKVT